MAIEVKKGKQETSMGRRLFSIAAPIVGGIYGGPAGAAAGSVLAAKVNGSSTQDALLGGAQTGISSKMGGSGGSSQAPSNPGEIIGQGAGGAMQQQQELPSLPDNSSAAARRYDSLSQNPQASVKEGLSVLEALPANHPLRHELGPAFIRADMISQQQGRGRV